MKRPSITEYDNNPKEYLIALVKYCDYLELLLNKKRTVFNQDKRLNGKIASILDKCNFKDYDDVYRFYKQQGRLSGILQMGKKRESQLLERMKELGYTDL